MQGLVGSKPSSLLWVPAECFFDYADGAIEIHICM